MKLVETYFGSNVNVDTHLIDRTKSFRKLPVFGCKSDKVDFQWPSIQELVELAPHGLCSLVWKEYSYCSNQYIAGIQLKFSNGVSSPLFMAKNVPTSGLKETTFSQSVRRIASDSDYNVIQQLAFIDENGNRLVNIKLPTKNPCVEVGLKEGEEIVGVYGYKN